MKIKIISDGTPQGTKVVNTETDERIEYVTSVQWKCEIGDIARARIEFLAIPVELTGEVKEDEKG